MKRFLVSAVLLAAATTAIQAHTLDGIVKDNKTGEPLIGTDVYKRQVMGLSSLKTNILFPYVKISMRKIAYLCNLIASNEMQ